MADTPKEAPRTKDLSVIDILIKLNANLKEVIATEYPFTVPFQKQVANALIATIAEQQRVNKQLLKGEKK